MKYSTQLMNNEDYQSRYIFMFLSHVVGLAYQIFGDCPTRWLMTARSRKGGPRGGGLGEELAGVSLTQVYILIPVDCPCNAASSTSMCRQMIRR